MIRICRLWDTMLLSRSLGATVMENNCGTRPFRESTPKPQVSKQCNPKSIYTKKLAIKHFLEL